MNKEALKTKAVCLLRRAGLSGVPTPVLACTIFIALFLVALGVWHFGFGQAQTCDPGFEVVASEKTNDSALGSDDGGRTASRIAVDVEGCVKAPGLYELEPDARVGDAIDAAGGLTKSAARPALNLAQKLEDGQQVYVQSKKQTSREQTASSGAGQGASGSQSVGVHGKSDDGKININTASSSELQKLSGIGESISQRIVEYREKNGSFSKVEDLTNVSGIGEARLAAIKDDICV